MAGLAPAISFSDGLLLPMDVIPGPLPGISIPDSASEAEMAGTGPAMTMEMVHLTWLR
jgi:hypothetical protein